jgi:hypothetical protein
MALDDDRRGKERRLNILALLLLVAAGQAAAGQPEASGPAPAESQRPGLWIADTAFSPADIAAATPHLDGHFGEPSVLVTFTEAGRAKFALLQQGRIGQVLEVSFDGAIVSSPVLRETIPGNRITISGGMTVAEAAALARRLAPSRRAHLFEGRVENLERLVEASHACGLSEVELSLTTPHLTPRVLIDIPERPDPRHECAMRWIGEHPDAGFRVPAPDS